MQVNRLVKSLGRWRTRQRVDRVQRLQRRTEAAANSGRSPDETLVEHNAPVLRPADAGLCTDADTDFIDLSAPDDYGPDVRDSVDTSSADGHDPGADAGSRTSSGTAGTDDVTTANTATSKARRRPPTRQRSWPTSELDDRASFEHPDLPFNPKRVLDRSGTLSVSVLSMSTTRRELRNVRSRLGRFADYVSRYGRYSERVTVDDVIGAAESLLGFAEEAGTAEEVNLIRGAIEYVLFIDDGIGDLDDRFGLLDDLKVLTTVADYLGVPLSG